MTRWKLLSDFCSMKTFTATSSMHFANETRRLNAVRAVDVGLRGMPDDVVLDWAAENNRIVISVDKRTLPNLAWRRVTDGLTMPGVVILRPWLSIGGAVHQLDIVANAGQSADFDRLVLYLPFKS